MKTITSIKHAIAYFKENSTTKITRTIGGSEYETIIPPVGFKRLIITDEHGVSVMFGSHIYSNYAAILERGTINQGCKIAKIKLYYL